MFTEVLNWSMNPRLWRSRKALLCTLPQTAVFMERWIESRNSIFIILHHRGNTNHRKTLPPALSHVMWHLVAFTCARLVAQRGFRDSGKQRNIFCYLLRIRGKHWWIRRGRGQLTPLKEFFTVFSKRRLGLFSSKSFEWFSPLLNLGSISRK